MPYFFDTETCGLHGLPVTIQWALNDGPITIHEIWRRPIHETLTLIELMMEEGVIGFNLAFDHFHLSKIYTVLSLVEDKNQYPEDIVEEIALLEPKGRFGKCLKPKHCFDLMLYARKGPFQALMARSDIRIRRVPIALAEELATKLEELIPLDSVLFSKRKNKLAPRWSLGESKNRLTGEVAPDFRDVVLKFAPSGSLKTLATYMGLTDEALIYDDAGVDRIYNPAEFGWAPFALAVSTPEKSWYHDNKKKAGKKKSGYAWPAVIDYHIGHWAYSTKGRKYAVDDVDYTRRMWYKFKEANPNLEMDDDDSVLACMVASVRWSGFDVNLKGLLECKENAKLTVKKAPKAQRQVKEFIFSAMNETEKIALQGSTSKVVLESISKWKDDAGNEHPAATRSKLVLSARKAEKEIELYDKLIQAGRFHASFIVIGTLSNRMAGSDSLNPQAINHSKFVRKHFIFCLGIDDTLCGGDFDSYEICIADAVYGDPQMRLDLESGVKLHAVMGAALFDKTMDEILASKGVAPPATDMYDSGKKGNFLLIYGGNEKTFETKLAISIEKGLEAFKRFFTRYPIFGKKRLEKMKAFCSMSQPKGLGTAVVWKDPSEFASSLFGFKRFFSLENRICKALFELAQNPPKHWKDIKIKVQRRDKFQTAQGATQSALYAAAFGLQGANMRAALNHEIQSTGATATKKLERRIWDHQPHGVHEFIVKPFNCHDEILSPTKKGHEEAVKKTVIDTIEEFRPTIPLINMEWKIGLKSWAEK